MPPPSLHKTSLNLRFTPPAHPWATTLLPTSPPSFTWDHHLHIFGHSFMLPISLFLSLLSYCPLFQASPTAPLCPLHPHCSLYIQHRQSSSLIALNAIHTFSPSPPRPSATRHLISTNPYPSPCIDGLEAHTSCCFFFFIT